MRGGLGDEMEEVRKRKELRLKQYDYSTRGAYFVTICIKDRQRILSDIIEPSPVGVGALDDPFGAIFDAFVPNTRLTSLGRIVEKNLLSSERIPGVTVDRYVIMPDHIHAIVFLDPDAYDARRNGSSRAPTPTNEMLPHIVSTFKRFCNREIGGNIFQRGYMEHIIRDRKDYETRARYICENPVRWYYEGK